MSVSVNREIRRGRPLKARFRRVVRHWELYLLLIPAVAAVIVFNYAPLYGIQLAFKEMRLGQTIESAKWVGMRNFVRYFNSGWFWRTIKNTFIIGITAELLFPLPILLAILMHNCVVQRLKKLTQTVTYIPHLVSVVVTISILLLFCDGETGLINIFRSRLGLSKVSFFGADRYVLPMYLITGVWQGTGSGAIVYLAALSAVDNELIEASMIDGCSKFKRMIHIDLPTIMPTVIIMLIMSLGRWFGVQTDKLLLLQTPLNMGASEATGTYTYKVGIQNAQYGMGTAIGLFVNVINFVMLISANFISKRVSETSLF